EKQQKQQNVQQAVGHFDAIVAVDKEVSQQLRREVDELDRELRQTQELAVQIERQAAQEQRDFERLADEKQKLEKQLSDAKQQLLDFREDRRAVNLESLSLRRDRGHLVEELAFLRRMAEDEEETLEVLGRTNQYLDSSYHDLEASAELLEQQRRELLNQIAKEREQVRHEERQNAELRNTLERLRREQAAVAQGNQEKHQQQLRVREMQGDLGPGLPKALSASGFSMPPPRSSQDSHSWASGLLGPPQSSQQLQAVVPAGARGVPRVPASAPLSLRSREGV
ncbi:unnamed protein product, partial [Polarella glacialis]